MTEHARTLALRAALLDAMDDQGTLGDAACAAYGAFLECLAKNGIADVCVCPHVGRRELVGIEDRGEAKRRYSCQRCGVVVKVANKAELGL